MDKFLDAFEKWVNIESPLQRLAITRDIPKGEKVIWSRMSDWKKDFNYFYSQEYCRWMEWDEVMEEKVMDYAKEVLRKFREPPAPGKEMLDQLKALPDKEVEMIRESERGTR